MQSARQHSSVVEDYHEKEVSINRVIGDKISGVSINKFGKNH